MNRERRNTRTPSISRACTRDLVITKILLSGWIWPSRSAVPTRFFSNATSKPGLEVIWEKAFPLTYATRTFCAPSVYLQTKAIHGKQQTEQTTLTLRPPRQLI